MFTQALPKTFSRVRRLSLAALVGLLATTVAAASADASTTAPADAVIASASGVSIDTTSGSPAAAVTSSGRSSSRSSRNALTLNPSIPVASGPSRPTVAKSPTAARTPSASQVDTSSIEAPIVGSPGRHQTSPASLAQIQASGPIVASSGTAAVARVAKPARRHSIRQPSPVWFLVVHAHHAAKVPVAPPVSSTVEINAPGVHVFISQTSARRPASPANRAAPTDPAVVSQIGTPGRGLAGLLSSDPPSVPVPGGPANTMLYGNASGPAGVGSLLGVDALLTLAVLLVGAVWLRRSWDLPVLPRQSALLSLALDRPG